MQTVKIRTSQNIEIDYEVANLGDRILGHIIDAGVIAGVFYVFYFIIIFIFAASLGALGAGGSFPKALIVIFAIFGLIGIFYNLVAEIFFNGQSIGKFAMKIKVISIDGARPTVGQYLMRWVFRLVDFGVTFGLGALISVAVSKNKQRIGDLVAGTTLVKTLPRTALDDLYFIAPEDGYEPVFQSAHNLTDDEVTLINEVLSAFKRTGNSFVVYEMTEKVKNHLGIQIPQGMNDYDFLTTVVKDYNYLTSRREA